MSTALVLPRFSELFKEICVDHESVTLPPLRSFPESFSRDRAPPSRSNNDSSGHGTGRSLLIHDFPNNVVCEVHTPSYGHLFGSRNSYSRDTSPSTESSDQDAELEGRQGQHYPHQTVLSDSRRKKDKSLTPGQSKPKKVKYHSCPICQKPFPRPSGLRAHMNMHTKEKPFECGFPGCPKRFSVSSNAKRHLRTHGVGLSPSDEPAPLPYVVDFEEPVVVAMDSDDSSASAVEPLSLRWMPLGAGSRRSHRTHNRTAIV